MDCRSRFNALKISIERVLLYIIWLSQSGVDSRGKALFAPTEDQKQDSNVLELIKKRSMTVSAVDVYKTDVGDR